MISISFLLRGCCISGALHAYTVLQIYETRCWSKIKELLSEPISASSETWSTAMIISQQPYLFCPAMMNFPRACRDAWREDSSEILTVGLIWHLRKSFQISHPSQIRGRRSSKCACWCCCCTTTNHLPTAAIVAVMLHYSSQKLGECFCMCSSHKWKLLFPLRSWAPNGWLHLCWPL